MRIDKKWEMMIYTLEGCKYCELLKKGLDTEGIRYTDVNISQNDILGDKIEEMWGCENYPMVELKYPQHIVWIPQPSFIHSPLHIKMYTTIEYLINQIKSYYDK